MRWEGTGNPNLPALLLSYLALCGLYVFVTSSFADSSDSLVIGILLATFILVRLVFLLTPITLTSDIHRYVWEGVTLRAGYNPYTYAPNSPELLELAKAHSTLWSQIQHAHLSAIYPPLALLLLTAFAHSALSWKCFLLACDVLSILVCSSLLQRANLPIGRVLYFAWLPLLWIESGISGHLESVMILPILIAVWLLTRSKSLGTLGAVAFGGLCATAVMVKYIAIVPLIFLVARYRQTFVRGKASVTGTSFLLVCCALNYPFLDFKSPGFAVFDSLGTYLTHWRFNDSLFHLIGGLFLVNWKDSASFTFIKYVLGAIWGLCTISLIRRHADWFTGTIASVLLLLLLSPVVHPWYGLWLAVFVIWSPAPAAIYLCLALPLSYVSLAMSYEQVPVWIKLIIYMPVVMLTYFRSTTSCSSSPGSSLPCLSLKIRSKPVRQ